MRANVETYRFPNSSFLKRKSRKVRVTYSQWAHPLMMHNLRQQQEEMITLRQEQYSEMQSLEHIHHQYRQWYHTNRLGEIDHRQHAERHSMDHRVRSQLEHGSRQLAVSRILSCRKLQHPKVQLLRQRSHSLHNRNIR